jgi:hypothetical protein
MVVVNGLVFSTTLLGGVTSADVSNMHPTLITPAGFTFAIWGIIYTLLLLFHGLSASAQKQEQALSQLVWHAVRVE